MFIVAYHFLKQLIDVSDQSLLHLVVDMFTDVAVISEESLIANALIV